MHHHSVLFLFLALQPHPISAVILGHFLRIILSLSSSPPFFPVSAMYMESPTPPSFPVDFSYRGHVTCSRRVERKAGLKLGACSRLFFINCWRWASWLLLQDLTDHLTYVSKMNVSHFTNLKSLTVTQLWASLQAEHFACFGLVCLVSRWVLRGERDLWHLRHPLRFSRNGTGNICALPSGVIVKSLKTGKRRHPEMKRHQVHLEYRWPSF